MDKGKKLAWLLRHDKAGLKQGKIDKNGWRKIEELISGYGFSKEEIDMILKENDKQRFEYNQDQTCIRARQGHSIKVDVELPETMPPEILYHGTTREALEWIYMDGIKPMSRLYVHLSENEETAEKVGQRHKRKEMVILKIRALDMWNNGIKFWKSRNGVWLCKYVDREYLL